MAAWSAPSPNTEAELAQALRRNNVEDLARSVEALASKHSGRDASETTFYRAMLELRRDRLDAALSLFASIPSSSAYFFDARNNMGAIFVRQGKLDLAKATLEEALQTQPALAMLHRNLGNLRAHMASKRYAAALQMLETPSAERLQLVLLTGPLARASEPTPPGATAEPVAPAAKEEAPTTATASAAQAALLAWRAAWEGKDLERYFGAYAQDYSPNDGKSRGAWLKDRQDRITSKGNIRIRLEEIEVQVLSTQHVRMRFRQHYDSDRFKSSSRKIMEMKWLDQQWRITLERTAEGGLR